MQKARITRSVACSIRQSSATARALKMKRNDKLVPNNPKQRQFMQGKQRRPANVIG